MEKSARFLKISTLGWSYTVKDSSELSSLISMPKSLGLEVKVIRRSYPSSPEKSAS